MFFFILFYFIFQFLIKLLRYIYFGQYINVGVERNLQRSIFIPHENDMIGKYAICLTIFLDYTFFLLIKLLYKLYCKLEHFFENTNSLFYSFCCIILYFSSSFFSFNPTQVQITFLKTKIVSLSIDAHHLFDKKLLKYFHNQSKLIPKQGVFFLFLFLFFK